MDGFLLLAADSETVAASNNGVWNLVLYCWLMLTSSTGLAVCGAVLFGLGTVLLVPPYGQRFFRAGATCALVGLLLLVLPTLSQLSPMLAFLLLEFLAVLGGIGTITSRSPVYAAIWFASALLAIGAIFLLSGAQFLGLATVAVYAGAIVVTFLFVLMLAQPEGHAVYDRMGWGLFPTACAGIAGASLVGIVCTLILPTGNPNVDGISSIESETDAESEGLESAIAQQRAARKQQQQAQRAEQAMERTIRDAIADASQEASLTTAESPRRIQISRNEAGKLTALIELSANSALVPLQDQIRNRVAAAYDAGQVDPESIRFETGGTLTDLHVANLGGQLFGRHLISIQVAGVLLLVGLVGAIAMASHGKDLVDGAARQEANL